MLANFEWFRSTVINLTDDSQRIQLLQDLKIAIAALDHSQVQFLSQNLPITAVFDCLNSSEREQVDVTSDVLSLLLFPLHLDTVIIQYGTMLMRALGHPITRVKEMVLKELEHATKDEASVLRLCQEPELLVGIANCISVEETGVGAIVIKLLNKLGTTTIGLNVIYSDPVLQHLKVAMETNSIVRFRVYEAMVAISAHSPTGLSVSQSNGLLPSLLCELDSSDIMGQLNTIELLTQLALTAHGLRHLEQGGIVEALAKRLAALDCDNPDPLASFLLPGLLKFFGNVAYGRPQEVFERYPRFVAVLMHTVNSADLVLANVAMETIGYIGSTLQGKCALNSLGDPMQQLLRKLGTNISTLQTEWRVRALNITANLLQLKEEEVNEPALALTHRWFSSLSENPMDQVLSLCKLPFPELRLAGLLVLKAIAGQRWGQQSLCAVPGFVEYLTNSSEEPNKMCIDSKYDIVRTIVESPDAGITFDGESLKRLKEFVREGPYFSRPVTQVVIENLAA